MRVIPQTPLEWVLLVVAAATGVIISVALQDFFIDTRHNHRIRALQDVGVAFAVIHFFGLTLVGSAGPRWTAVAIAMYVGHVAVPERARVGAPHAVATYAG